MLLSFLGFIRLEFPPYRGQLSGLSLMVGSYKREKNY